MNSISPKDTKSKMIRFLQGQKRENVLEVINYINNKVKDDEYQFHIPLYGKTEELYSRISSDRDLKKETLYRAISQVLLKKTNSRKAQEKSPEQSIVSFREKILSQNAKRMGQLVSSEDLKDEKFNLDIFNLDVAPDNLIQRVNNFYRLRTKSELNIKNLTALFSGPSGTGKTYLAKFLAKYTNKNVLITSPSSFLGAYVGETEKQIKAVFDFAESHDLILFLDEVEGLISPRESTSQSWEMTSINQFLISLENFKGVCIAATNLHDGIDSAFYRRFSDKVKFDYIKDEKVEDAIRDKFHQLLVHEKKLNENQLSKVKFITPGDLEAVYKRIVLDDRKYTFDEITEELLREQKSKAHLYKSRIGVGS